MIFWALEPEPESKIAILFFIYYLTCNISSGVVIPIYTFFIKKQQRANMKFLVPTRLDVVMVGI